MVSTRHSLPRQPTASASPAPSSTRAAREIDPKKRRISAALKKLHIDGTAALGNLTGNTPPPAANLDKPKKLYKYRGVVYEVKGDEPEDWLRQQPLTGKRKRATSPDEESDAEADDLIRPEPKKPRQDLQSLRQKPKEQLPRSRKSLPSLRRPDDKSSPAPRKSLPSLHRPRKQPALLATPDTTDGGRDDEIDETPEPEDCAEQAMPPPRSRKSLQSASTSKLPAQPSQRHTRSQVGIPSPPTLSRASLPPNGDAAAALRKLARLNRKINQIKAAYGRAEEALRAQRKLEARDRRPVVEEQPRVRIDCSPSPPHHPADAEKDQRELGPGEETTLLNGGAAEDEREPPAATDTTGATPGTTRGGVDKAERKRLKQLRRKARQQANASSSKTTTVDASLPNLPSDRPARAEHALAQNVHPGETKRAKRKRRRAEMRLIEQWGLLPEEGAENMDPQLKNELLERARKRKLAATSEGAKAGKRDQ